MIGIRALGLLAVGFVACSGGSDGDVGVPPPVVGLEPPPGTGDTVIQMAGTWEVTAVEILSQQGRGFMPPTPGMGFWPPAVGSVVRIDDLGIVDLDGFDPSTFCQASGQHEILSNVNRQDGRFAILDLQCMFRSTANEFMQTIRRGGFGSAGPDTILGDFQVWQLGGVSVPGAISSGLYRLSMARR